MITIHDTHGFKNSIKKPTRNCLKREEEEKRMNKE
jgi:hypothetical protein